MADNIHQIPSTVPERSSPRPYEQPFGNRKPKWSLSRALSFWKAPTKSRFRSGLAISGLLSIAALLLRRKHRGYADDTSVDDFTANQEAMLERVREIWNEYCTEVQSSRVDSQCH